MPNHRQKMVSAINQKIKENDKRKLVWFGTRGTDSRALLDLDYFTELFSLVAPLNSLALNMEICLETEKKLRVDLDSYTVDDDTSEEAAEMHRRLFASLAEPTYLVSYRPSNFLTSIYFPRSRYVEYLGLFHELQDPFEHKPWVETELNKIGITTVPWDYLGDEDRPLVEEMLEQGPKVLRTNRSDGGAGLTLVERVDDLDKIWVPHRDHFLGIAPYLHPNIPLNLNAVVFSDGRVTLHPPSLQLIGLPGCTNRKFGYCGNDFAQVGDIPDKFLDDLEEFVRKAGAWLAQKGYLGAFGIDALICNDQLYLTEINPRFQGSSDLSSWIDLDMRRSDMFLDHIAAFLGIEPIEDKIPLKDLAKQQMKVSQIICHNIEKVPLERNEKHATETDKISFMLMPVQNISVMPEAILFRAVIHESVTPDGDSLCEPYAKIIQDLVKDLFSIGTK
jgi:hypothetical protein